MTVVGTVGHIDHGKTALLHALTGIDADRLPEERRRGMTIDVGYAHMDTDDGASIDFVDLPGHHDLTGNLLVGVGEIDAAMLVIAADEGAQAQTFEHLDILDAYGITEGVAVVTKLDLVDEDRRRDAMATAEQLLEASALRGALLIGVSSRTGEGIGALRQALSVVDGRVRRRCESMFRSGGSARLAVDRVFRSRGRGLVVTGTLRGSVLSKGHVVRVEPGGGSARIREIQVHEHTRASVQSGGRVALNLASTDGVEPRRGSIIVRGPAVAASRRLLIAGRLVAPRTPAGERQVVVHIGTDRVTGALHWLRPAVEPGPAGRDPGLAIITLGHSVAAAPGDRLVIRIPSPPQLYVAGFVIDPTPPAMATRVLRARFSGPIPSADDAPSVMAALLGYRRAMSLTEFESATAALNLDGDVTEAVTDATVIGPIIACRDAAAELDEAVRKPANRSGGTRSDALESLEATRARVGRILRRYGGLSGDLIRRVSAAFVDRLLDDGRLQSVGDLVLDVERDGDMATQLNQAESTLLRSLATAHPPGLSRAAESAGLPMAAIPRLVSAGRMVRLAPDTAYASDTYTKLVEVAVEMARSGRLSAAAFRDTVGTSRRNAVVLLDAMSQAGVIRREGTGHVLGPRAPGGDSHSADGDDEMTNTNGESA